MEELTVTREQLEEVVNKIRPYLQADGGDLELLGMDENNVVYVAMRGACNGCFMAAEDFSSGIRELILDEVPGVREVYMVNN